MHIRSCCFYMDKHRNRKKSKLELINHTMHAVDVRPTDSISFSRCCFRLHSTRCDLRKMLLMVFVEIREKKMLFVVHTPIAIVWYPWNNDFWLLNTKFASIIESRRLLKPLFSVQLRTALTTDRRTTITRTMTLILSFRSPNRRPRSSGEVPNYE